MRLVGRVEGREGVHLKGKVPKFVSQSFSNKFAVVQELTERDFVARQNAFEMLVDNLPEDAVVFSVARLTSTFPAASTG